jgi:plastocyanin
MRKVLLALPALALAMVAVFASTENSAQAAAVTLKVRAGDGETGYAVNTFLPSSVYVRAGDTITWSFPWDEPHSVTFGEIQGNPEEPTNPDDAVVDYDGTGFVNSGLVFGPNGPEFSVKFTSEGTYDYFCFIHPFMTGKVYVQGPGIGEQDNQASIDARGASDYTSQIAELKSAAGAAAAKPVAISSKAGGGKKYTLMISSANDVMVGDVMQFFPGTLNVGINDQVEFVSNVHTPHDVAFLPAGMDLAGPPPPELAAWDPFASGVNYSVGVKVDGTKFIASPMLGLEFPDGVKASFTMSKAGSYTYACILHASQGMMGKINVTSGAPGAPNTGDSLVAPAQQSGTSGILFIAGAIALAMGATAAAAYTTRR